MKDWASAVEPLPSRDPTVEGTRPSRGADCAV